MKVSAEAVQKSTGGIERRFSDSRFSQKALRGETATTKEGPVVVEIKSMNHLASENDIQSVFEAANLLKEIGRFVANNEEEALSAQGNLQENRVRDLLNLT